MVFSDLSFSPQALVRKTAKWYMGLQYPTSPSANLCRTFYSQPIAVDESNIWMQS